MCAQVTGKLTQIKADNFIIFLGIKEKKYKVKTQQTKLQKYKINAGTTYITKWHTEK